LLNHFWNRACCRDFPDWVIEVAEDAFGFNPAPQAELDHYYRTGARSKRPSDCQPTSKLIPFRQALSKDLFGGCSYIIQIEGWT
jgi:hypothetical protein